MQIDFDKIYKPYPRQAEIHASPAPYLFLGGAAGAWQNCANSDVATALCQDKPYLGSLKGRL